MKIVLFCLATYFVSCVGDAVHLCFISNTGNVEKNVSIIYDKIALRSQCAESSQIEQCLRDQVYQMNLKEFISVDSVDAKIVYKLPAKSKLMFVNETSSIPKLDLIKAIVVSTVGGTESIIDREDIKRKLVSVSSTERELDISNL